MKLLDDRAIALARELLEVLNLAGREGACDICGRDTTASKQSNIKRLFVMEREIACCNYCVIALRRMATQNIRKRLGSIEHSLRQEFALEERLEVTMCTDHISNDILVEWLALGLLKKAKLQKQIGSTNRLLLNRMRNQKTIERLESA